MESAVLVPVDEYLANTYDPDCEYVDGELLELPMAETDHGGLQAWLAAWCFERRKEYGIHVYTETRTQVAPDRFRVPDLAITIQKAQGRVLSQPPLLCIEILSPEDRASGLEEKIDDYLRFGVPFVWIIDPRKRMAWSYTKDGKREAAGVLATSSPLIELAIRDLFEAQRPLPAAPNKLRNSPQEPPAARPFCACSSINI